MRVPILTAVVAFLAPATTRPSYHRGYLPGRDIGAITDRVSAFLSFAGWPHGVEYPSK